MKKKRILIDVTEDMHTKVKKHAVERNITMRIWVTRALQEALRREEQFE
jgi:hypothetical protein